MSNYFKVFTGNFIEVQRIFNELENLNICAIIKDESESGRLVGFAASIPGIQEIHVHKEEIDRAVLIVKRLKSKLQA